METNPILTVYDVNTVKYLLIPKKYNLELAFMFQDDTSFNINDEELAMFGNNQHTDGIVPTTQDIEEGWYLIRIAN